MAQDFGAFLQSANPNLPKPVVADLVKHHVLTLKAVIDANSGMNIAARIGEAWDKAEEPGRAKALERGNTIATMPDAEVQKMMALSQGVIDAWVAEMDAAGKDGKAMLEAARALIDKYGS